MRVFCALWDRAKSVFTGDISRALWTEGILRRRVGDIRGARRNDALQIERRFEAHILYEFVLGLAAIDRYERRGIARRKFAKRRFDTLGAERSGGHAKMSDAGEESDLRRAVLMLLDAAAPELMAAEIERARRGDPAARRFCLELSLKARLDRPVSFPMSKGPACDAAEMTGYALAAVADGELTPREGREVVAFITAHFGALQAGHWERRLRELEGRSRAIVEGGAPFVPTARAK